MIVGHQKQWQFLERVVKANRASHAYLFCGQEKLGKRTIALEFAKLLNGPCLSKSCNPDLILIKPEDTVIQIAQIRELNRGLSLKPHSSLFKIAIIDRAHCLNQEAQNCFLKTLEEPRGKTILILITEMPELLFPTILSRVQVLKFYPVKKEEIENYLQQRGIKEKESKEITKFSQGRPGEAIDFLLNPKKLEIQKQKIKELISLTNSSLAFRFQYVKKLSEEPSLREILNIWLSYFREVLLSNYSALSVKHHNYSIRKLKNILKQIQSTNFLISTTNVNPRLILETLMLEF